MNIIISDVDINFSKNDTVFYNVKNMDIKRCMGCFCCWVKTPGSCIIKDETHKIYTDLAKSNRVVYISHIINGTYDFEIKKVQERMIPVQQAFIRLHKNETHHVQRNNKEKEAYIIVYGDTSEKSLRVFKKLVDRNSLNMNFKSVEIICTNVDKVENCVKEVMSKWVK